MAKRSKGTEPPKAGPIDRLPDPQTPPAPPPEDTEGKGDVDMSGMIPGEGQESGEAPAAPAVAPEGKPPKAPTAPKAPKVPKPPKPWRGVKMESAGLKHAKDFEADPASIPALPGHEEIDQSLWTDGAGNVYYLDQTASGLYTLRPWKMVVS